MVNDINVPDRELREWISIHDVKGKGYVNLQDYLAAKFLPGMDRILPATGKVAEKSGTKTSDRAIMSKTSSGRLQERDKLHILKQAFDMYDRDGDGFISRIDLKNTFDAQGKPKSDQEITEWMKRSDSHNTGFVDFDDFVQNYSSRM